MYVKNMNMKIFTSCKKNNQKMQSFLLKITWHKWRGFWNSKFEYMIIKPNVLLSVMNIDRNMDFGWIFFDETVLKHCTSSVSHVLFGNNASFFSLALIWKEKQKYFFNTSGIYRFFKLFKEILKGLIFLHIVIERKMFNACDLMKIGKFHKILKSQSSQKIILVGFKCLRIELLIIKKYNFKKVFSIVFRYYPVDEIISSLNFFMA